MDDHLESNLERVDRRRCSRLLAEERRARLIEATFTKRAGQPEDVVD